MSLFDCCAHVGSFTKSTPAGQETSLGGRDCYVTGDASAQRALLIVADVFGWRLTNTRVLADRFAKEIGARVYIPDFLDGDDFTQAKQKNPSWQPDFPSFLAKHHPGKPAEPLIRAAVAAIRKEQGEKVKIGAVGYCWGALPILHLSSKNAGAEQVDAVAFAHPSLLADDGSDFAQLAKPALFLTCETDAQLPDAKREAAIEACKKKAREDGVFVRFSYYPNCSHGWAIKGDENDAYTAKAMQHAAIEMVGFFRAEL